MEPVVVTTIPKSDTSGGQVQVEHESRRSNDSTPVNPSKESSGSYLEGLSQDELTIKGEEYCLAHGIDDSEDVRAFRLGVVLAAKPGHVRQLEGLRTDESMVLIHEEKQNLLSMPGKLWFVAVVCSICAAVQGMDETTVNGAQIFYKQQFGMGARLLGAVNAAPYACCALLSCWLTKPLNDMLGRRGTVALCCAISCVACLGQAFSRNWYTMLGIRILLGLGIGPKSATTPMYAAECAPSALRGALTMQWQLWTAFGIMLGFAVDLAFLPMANESLKWRLMIGSTAVPALIGCSLCFFCPESPRYHLQKGRHHDAYKSMCRIRKTKVQAARDVFLAHVGLQTETSTTRNTGMFGSLHELFTVTRNRNAFVASQVVMMMQQFCGVNIIAYYSSHFLVSQGFPYKKAFAISLGWGAANFLGAFPAIFTIDKFGRRNLLLCTFPLMFASLLFTGLSSEYLVGTSKMACIILGTYLFVLVYSPGAGPVPFTYSAEAYPLHIRPLGMSIATATTWFFNCLLALTFPILQEAAKPVGAFSLYALFNLAGFFLTLFFVPETKGKSLEQLDGVFGVPSRVFQAYGARQFAYFWGRGIMGRRMERPRVPYLREPLNQDHGVLSSEA